MYNLDVDGCEGEVVIKTEEYFIYYPEMNGKITPEQITYEIRFSKLLDQIFRQWCSDHRNILTAPMASEVYYQLLHTLAAWKYLRIKVTNGMKINV